MTADKTPPILLESIESKIFVTRGHCERVEPKAPGTRRRPPCGEKVMLDEDLAILYGVETKVLLQAVKRNRERFPDDFMFQLDAAEWKTLRSQFVTSNENPVGRGGRRYAPYAFTEQGVAMLSSVLRSERAIHVNIEIMRAFVRLRQMLTSNAELWIKQLAIRLGRNKPQPSRWLARKLNALEKKYDIRFKAVFEAIHDLMAPAESKKKRPIGFAPWDNQRLGSLLP